MLHVIFSLVAIVPLFSPSRDRSKQSVIKTLVVEEQEVNKLLTAESWPQLQALVDWSNRPEDARVRIAKRLLPALHSNSRVALGETANMMIPYRVLTGEMKASTEAFVNQDLFLTGGRAAWGIDRLLRVEESIILDGGLTPGEWNERASKIEARVQDFAVEAGKPKKPPVPLHRIRGWSSPHVVPAVNGILAARQLLALSDDPWPAPKVVVALEERLIQELLTTEDWSRLRRVYFEFSAGLPEEAKGRIITRLLPVLRDTTPTPVKGADDLFLANRIASGDLKPSPERVYQPLADVFLKGGRAAYGIGGLLDNRYELHGGMTVDEWTKRVREIETRLQGTLDRIEKPKTK